MINLYKFYLKKGNKSPEYVFLDTASGFYAVATFLLYTSKKSLNQRLTTAYMGLLTKTFVDGHLNPKTLDRFVKNSADRLLLTNIKLNNPERPIKKPL